MDWSRSLFNDDNIDLLDSVNTTKNNVETMAHTRKKVAQVKPNIWHEINIRISVFTLLCVMSHFRMLSAHKNYEIRQWIHFWNASCYLISKTVHNTIDSIAVDQGTGKKYWSVLCIPTPTFGELGLKLTESTATQIWLGNVRKSHTCK
jgi:hypothetical protein